MCAVECDDAVDRFRIAHDVKRLDVFRLVVRHADDPADFYLVKVGARDRIFEVRLVDSIPLLDDLDLGGVPQPPQAVAREGALVCVI